MITPIKPISGPVFKNNQKKEKKPVVIVIPKQEKMKVSLNSTLNNKQQNRTNYFA